MYKLLPLLALIAVPAAAQDASWKVTPAGRTCTATQPIADSGSGRLMVSYDAARQEVTLPSPAHVESPLPDTGAMDLMLVFLDNGAMKFDDQWRPPRATHARSGDMVNFSTLVAGTLNVEQIFTDLSSSRRVGFLKDKEPILDHPLAGIGGALAQLKDCAARSAAGHA